MALWYGDLDEAWKILGSSCFLWISGYQQGPAPPQTQLLLYDVTFMGRGYSVQYKCNTWMYRSTVAGLGLGDLFASGSHGWCDVDSAQCQPGLKPHAHAPLRVSKRVSENRVKKTGRGSGIILCRSAWVLCFGQHSCRTLVSPVSSCTTRGGRRRCCM